VQAKKLHNKNNIRAVIIDDERSGRLVLQTLITEYCKDVEVVAVEVSAEEGKKAISNLHPDIVFLDIEMPFQTGFEMLESLETRDFAVVFVTAYEYYTALVTPYSPLGLLLKPFNLSQLRKTIEKYRVERVR